MTLNTFYKCMLFVQVHIFVGIFGTSAQTDDMYIAKTIRDALKFDFTPLAMCLSLPSGARFDRKRVR